MSRKGTVQAKIEYGATRALFWLLRVLPKRAALGLGIGIVRLTFLILGSRLRSGLRSLEIAFPEMDAGTRKRILRASVESIGRTTVEFAKFQPASAEDSRSVIEIDFDAEEFQAYKKAKAEGRGVLMPTAHIGNWELLLSGFALQYEPIYFMARELDNPLIDKMFADIREGFGSRQFYKSDSAKEVLKALKRGKSVGLLPDVNVDLREGIFVPFFGHQASTTAGVARLAIHANALILPMFAIWDKVKDKYIVHYGTPIEPTGSADREAEVYSITAALTAEIEKIVRQYPEQWLWIHRRWKTRPPGDASLY
ncbi:MAG: lysophospholipid acyltransferase family protein [Pyrinomonadaceae bacterium]